MKKEMVIALVAAATLHGVLIFGFELFKEKGPSYETVELTSGEDELPPPPPPPVEPEEDEEGEQSDEPVLPEDLINTGLTEPPSSDIAISALSQIVKPEPPRPPRPAGLDSALIPTGAARASSGKGGIPEIVFDLSDLDRPPRVLYEAAPAYPPELRRVGIGGKVDAMWTVNKEGRVVEAHIESSTNPDLDGPVLTAIHKYRFEPGTKNGRPVFFKIRRVFTFDVNKSR